MSQKENKESQLKIIDEKTDDFLKTLLNIKVNNEENDESVSTEDDDEEDVSYAPSETSDDSSVSDASKSIKSAISKIFPSFKEKDYKLIKQKVDKLSELIDKIKADDQKISKDDKENLKKEIKTLIITILQLNNESNIIDAYEPLFTKNLIVSNEITDSKYNLDIQDNSKKVIGISGVLNKDFIGKLKYLDEFIQLKEKTKDNVENIIAEVGNTSIKDLKDLLEKQKKAKEEKQINLISKDAAGNAITLGMQNTLQNQANPNGGKRTFKRRRKTRINKKNKRKTNKSKQNKK